MVSASIPIPVWITRSGEVQRDGPALHDELRGIGVPPLHGASEGLSEVLRVLH